MKANPYVVLEVSPRASEEVIEAAYRTLAKKHADDEAKLKALNNAKDILLDEDEKKKFDKGLVGKMIGSYKIKDEIAEGGFGKTYLGEHSILGTPVCLKHAHFVSPQDEELLIEEAKSVWDLRHYSIPNIREIVRHTDDSLVLVMSYIPGPTLAQILEKHKRVDAEHIAWIAERALNALKYLHFHGVVHGDVKPQNIIIQPDSHQVVLVDYGLSLIRPNKTSTNKGYTPHYSSPEAVNGDPLLPESDFYSLGMTMIAGLGGDVEMKKVPNTTPDPLCKFIKSLIAFEVTARPHWKKIDLCDEIREVRQKSFGRTASGMKPLPKM